MKPIQMVDLVSQYARMKDEMDAVLHAVLDSGRFINGEEVSRFQTELATYTGSRYAVTCGSGTDALMLAMMALGLQPGDEVITVPFTFVSTAEVLSLLGLKTRFVDVRPDTFTMDSQQLEAAITPKTKAIVPVHLYGQCADMQSILDIARRHGCFVVEDACQAIGATVSFDDGSRKQAGTMGDVGCLSFFPSKNLGCYGDGGALLIQNEALAAKAKQLANHGMIRKYCYGTVGINSRLDTLQAAVLRIKLRHLDEFVQDRCAAAAFYNQSLSDCSFVDIPAIADYSTHVYHQYTLKLKNFDRNSFVSAMNVAGIPTMVYYPVPLHLQKAYNSLDYRRGDFPVSESLSETVVSLPMHTELDEEQLRHITQQILLLQSKR